MRGMRLGEAGSARSKTAATWGCVLRCGSRLRTAPWLHGVCPTRARVHAADDARQPVLIAGAITPASGARHVALVDGAWRDAELDFDRAFHFFDDDHIAAARIAWKSLAARDGVERRYWKQNDAGRWEQAA